MKFEYCNVVMGFQSLDSKEIIEALEQYITVLNVTNEVPKRAYLFTKGNRQIGYATSILSEIQKDKGI